MSPIIRVSGLSKVYKHYWGPRSLLKEVLFGVVAHSQQWALKDINFELAEGEAFGIVGNNGAGKSTLLKVLAGTAFPTSGIVKVSGRVTALLELGAGFHPEFSGRENIYFNGALLGLSREDIRAREKEIIEFSELEDFIAKPVKTYSSGMYLRLGFAVATGFDPSVLIIDEALAVGDQHFQKKCTDRIMGFRREGRTIIFCSHNLYQVKTLCERTMWLDKGTVRALGPSDEVVEEYTNELRQESRTASSRNGGSGPVEGTGDSWVTEALITGSSGEAKNEFQTGETLRVTVSAVFRPGFLGEPAVGISIVRNDGVAVFVATTTRDSVELTRTGEDKYTATLILADLQLLSGAYVCHAFTTDQDEIQAYGGKFIGFAVKNVRTDQGLVQLPHRWE